MSDMTSSGLFEEMYPEAKSGDKIKEYSLLVTSTNKPCRVCGKLTHFVEWCTESPLCGKACYNKHFDYITEACREKEDTL